MSKGIRSRDGLRNRLRAELLATALATRAQDLATAGGLLACKESVPTGTHKIAGLESPLHIILE